MAIKLIGTVPSIHTHIIIEFHKIPMSWLLLVSSFSRWESSGIEVPELPQSHTICKRRAAAWPWCCAGQCPGIDLGAVACSSLSVPSLVPVAGLSTVHLPPASWTSVSLLTPPWNYPTEKQGAGDRGSRWFKKVIKELCLLFGFLKPFKFQVWTVGLGRCIPTVWVTAKSWVCPAQRSDLRVI